MGLPIRSNAMRIRHKVLRATFAACGICVMFADSARAADTSAWVADTYSAVRLLAGANKANAESLRAGIEMKIQPGWHTYWRYSGDSGVPPRFNFSGSDNIAAVKVLYPAPRALSDEAGTTIGYTGNVILPLRVTPQQKGKPVTLRVKIEYAVCEKLCVPVEASTELTIHSAGVESDALLTEAEARVPKPMTAAVAGLIARRVNDDKRKPLVLVDLATRDVKPAQIFVEGPSADWALPIPKPAQGAPAGHQHFSFELDGLPRGVDPKGPLELTFTIVRGDRASEVKTSLD
jgi:DsbC/DsbD-like thiol-disulfide interchange protein